MRAGVHVHTGVVDGGDGRRPEEANPVVGQYLCDPLADLVTEPALQGHGFGGDHRGRHPAAGEAGGGLAADQPAADHDRGVGAAGGHPQDDGVGERAQGERGLGAGDAQRDGVGAAGKHEMPVGVAAAALGDDFLVNQVDVVDGDAAQQVDVVTDEPAGAVQVVLGLPAAEVGLAERGLGIGQGGVGAQDPHGDVGVLAAERLRRAQPCRTAADGDEAWCHHTSWLSLFDDPHVRVRHWSYFGKQRCDALLVEHGTTGYGSICA